MPSPRILLCAVGLSASAAWAQTTSLADMCHDTTGQDRQAAFSATSGMTMGAVSLVTDASYKTGTPSLRLNTNLQVLDTEHIFFPFDQQVSISYLYESAGNSGALGYFYYNDLIARGYIDTKGTADTSDDSLADLDGDGIADFHEDLYGMSSDATRVFSSSGRRCSKPFTYTIGKKSYTVYEPDLTLNKSCTSTYVASSSQPDARPGAHKNINVSVVGSNGSRADYSALEYGDQGLYPTIPNLLEPRDAKNNLKGIGHFVFMHADDDDDLGTYNNLAPIADSSNLSNGIPDYNVSAYEDGRLLSPVPDTVLDQENDRTVNLGTVQGNQEIVFFLVGWGGSSQNPAGGQVWPCLRFNTDGSCALHLITPTSVYFSRTFLNLDQNPVTPTPTTGVGSTVATRDIGCAYGSSAGCKTDGWLDQATLDRMKTVPAYDNLVMPHEVAYVKADPSGRGMMPHVFMGAPSTDKFRWILGFEDLPGGGDRDFNDVSFMIHKSNGAQIRSAVVSDDLSPSISQDYTITEVTFRVVDDSFYTNSTGGGSATACSSYSATDRPQITYQVALDCKVCTANCSTTTPTLTANPTPSWVDVPIPDAPLSGTRDQTVVMRDFLNRGLTGSQLCWQAVMKSKYDQCQPTIVNVDVSYKAVKAGDYGRAAVSAVANVVLYGTYETRGKKWFDPAVTQPSTRVIDQTPDLVDRGHLYFKELYEPVNRTVTTGVLEWDSGSVLSTALKDTLVDPLKTRKLITMDPTNARAEVKQVLTATAGGEAFNTSAGGNCAGLNGGHYDCDLNNSGGPPDADDRTLLLNWLYGWESGTGTTGIKRTWPMGGVQLSTPSIVGMASAPAWLSRVKTGEPTNYQQNFLSDSRLLNRSTVAYVGTTQGYLHGVDAGALKTGDDQCTSDVYEARGYFAMSSPCTTSTRQYGSATERFAYLPRKLLPYYVNSYVRSSASKMPLVDASPSVADVDLGSTAATYSPTQGIPSSVIPTWKISSPVKPLEGAKTVLVTATGPGQGVLFALDITDPSSTTYPLPMWEFDMGQDTVYTDSKGIKYTVESAFTDIKPAAALTPDTAGSRHSPPIVKMNFGKDPTTGGGDKWVAVVGTDYVPNDGTAGTVYLMDIKTGLPAKIPGTSVAAQLAGVVPLALKEGVAGEPAAVDSDGDGSYDLLYVATTNGKIFRINTAQSNATRALGQVPLVCQVADIKNVKDSAMTAVYTSEIALQGIYSSMAVTVLDTASSSTSSKTVRLVVGTANNPDLDDDAADTATTVPHGYLIAFEDTSPSATNCTTPATFKWVQQLGQGQAVWGGVTASGDEVFTSTGVGKAASACELSPTVSGRFYDITASTGKPKTADVAINGHSLSSPVMHDGHLLLLTADGKVMVRGDLTKWNNPAVKTAPGPVTPRLWDANVNGEMYSQ